jgi:hypothetical protein
MYIHGAHIEHGGKCYNSGMGNIVSISQTIKLYLLTTELLSLCNVNFNVSDVLLVIL